MRLEVRDGQFSYRETGTVFTGLNLTVAEKGVLCILGRNGCGKTTLLKCVAGMCRLERGEVLIDGKNIANMTRNQLARIMGYIPQEQLPTFPYTVAQIVIMGRAPYLTAFSSPSAWDIRIAEEAMERVGISHLKEKRYTQLSGGERQLAVIARVLAQQPRILLLDEPTSHLDFKNQTLILAMIKRLANEGLAVIMTSHFPNHALWYADLVALMDGGHFAAVGRPETVLTSQNLSATYGMPVRVFSLPGPDGHAACRVCVPTLPR